MNLLKTYFLIGLLFSFHSSLYGQFNTLTPTMPKKTENVRILEKTEETKDLKKKTDKKFWKDIFNATSKAELKKELDSLKRWIMENSDKKDKKWDVKEVKDSLILDLQSRRLIHQQKRDFENMNDQVKFSKIAMPLSNAFKITSSYGKRIHPITGTVRMHNGIDLKGYFENVYAVMDGIVTASGWDPKGGGNYIKVKHFNRFETAYLHLSESYYKVGEMVRTGYIIAKSGNTGNSTGPHLHFAVKKNEKFIDPMHFLNDLIRENHLLIASYGNESTSYFQK